jgi:hypothetical protein
MFAILHALGMLVANLFKSRSRVEAENLFLRHQLAIALRRVPPRFRLRGGDRALLIWMTRLWPSLIGAVHVVQPDLAWIAVAKWLCGTPDRHRAPRMPGPTADLWRVAPAANSCFVYGVLQSGAHALGITKRCALASSSPRVRCHCCHSDLGRTASSIRPDMIFGKDRN